MNSEQRQQIRGLVKKYSDNGTESLIAYVAGTNGMLAACQALLHSLDAEGSTGNEWLQRECSEKNVTFHAFLREVTKIVDLFQPSRDAEDHHATLGVSADAGPDEIKQAYRALSLRYHPDTASPPYRNNPEKFIAINKAYHALLSVDTNSEKNEYIHQEKQWRKKKERTVSPDQAKRVFTWTLALLIVLAVISIIASMNYKKRAMLAGLQESRGAFIPPAKKETVISTGKEDKAENQPTERPALAMDTTKTPHQKHVAKIETKPEVDPVGVQLKELPQKDSGKAIAVPVNTDKEKRPVKQPDEVRPNRTKEKIDAVAVAATEKNDHPAATLKHQSIFREQAGSIKPDVVFNSKLPIPAANNIDGKEEREVQLTHATVTEVAPLSADPVQADKHKHEKSDMQTRVDRFFTNYIKAYEQRNLILFSRFFESDAEENGKPFTAILATYLDLFAATKQIALQVEQRNWHLVDGKVAVDGRFKVYLEYLDGRTINGSGPIGFVLADNDGELLVKKMEYVFHTE